MEDEPSAADGVCGVCGVWGVCGVCGVDDGGSGAEACNERAVAEENSAAASAGEPISTNRRCFGGT